MNEQDLRTICKSLRLAYVADIFSSIEVEAEKPEQYLKQVLLKELELRETARIERNLKKARFLEEKHLETYQWNHAIRLPETTNRSALEELEFIKNRQNLVLVGAPGTGKTHLASALGHRACEKGYEVRFYRVAHLVEELEAAYRNGRITAYRKKFESVDLLILDEMGYVPFSKEGAEILFQLITDFYEQKSLIVTSNLEFSQWNRIFSDSRLTAALVDRLIHHAHVISYVGESYRLTNALSRTK
ncbi:IS21-like element helper ATPase IstB [Domibacillus enclensis]|uniref:ATP-binding protein n=1 Tax=Domibacillus enclensis TaxID=1017273 RepID=A0A1N6NDW6_9BACI|nr:IS21-like element helper ATPase IstB [Domibacillus enclensis]OXS80015.1 ATP-binding protein [Domibacillus enclensis]SIP90270.1 DNA replication protein DnaC [Domibacillus enclensis]